MKTRILLVLMAFVFGLSNMTQAQKLSRKKVQITGLKNAKVLGTDAKGNVFDNSKLLKEAPEYQAGENITIDESNPLKPIINSVGKDYDENINSINNKIKSVNSALINKVDKTDKSLFVPYKGAKKDVVLGDDVDNEKLIHKQNSTLNNMGIDVSVYRHTKKHNFKGRIDVSTKIRPASIELSTYNGRMGDLEPKSLTLDPKGISGNVEFLSRSTFKKESYFEKGIVLEQVDKLPNVRIGRHGVAVGTMLFYNGGVYLFDGRNFNRLKYEKK